jgi:phosphinothricin acetyltransferase
MQVRPAVPQDAADIARIYNQGIEDRVATFEVRLRSAADIRDWFGGTHPVVVVEKAGEVVAFAAAHPYSPRECYRGIAGVSVYVARHTRRCGAGRLALAGLIDAAAGAGFWKLLSHIFVENTASRALCRSLGFREVGVCEKHARLDGVWRDCVLVERLLERTKGDIGTS